jgi:hypothetical protein
MADIWSIPKDANGLPLGAHYLRHSTSDLNATIGSVHFVNGRSTRAITGNELLRMVMAIGADVALEAEGATAGDAEAVPAPEPPAPAPAPEPPRVAEAPSAVAPPQVPAPSVDDLDAIDDVDVLRALAASLYLDVDGRWKASRLRAEIRAARGG